MKREELLRRLEERLARGEISEKTYLDIKARYDTIPEEPSPPPPPSGPRHGPGRDLEATIEQTIESAMQQVGRVLEGTVGPEFEARMEDMGKRLEVAFSKIGPRVEAGGRTVIIRGSGVVSGNTTVDEFRCSGSGRVSGDLHAGEVHISGACKIDGACEAKEFHTSGSANVAGDLRADEINVSGSLAVGGDIRGGGSPGLGANEVNVAGGLTVGGRVETQEFTSRGRFEIGGGLEAQEVSVRLAGTSRVPSIKGQEIDVRRGQRNGELEAETIEGDEVYLEATRAHLVKGREVRIGPFCTIDRAEAGELEIHEMSTVKEQGPSEDGEEHGKG